MTYYNYSTLDRLLQGMEVNLNMSLENMVLLFTAMGMLIFFAKDFRLGVIMTFFFISLEFTVFSILGMATRNSLYAMLLSLVLMALTLYISYSKKGRDGGLA